MQTKPGKWGFFSYYYWKIVFSFFGTLLFVSLTREITAKIQTLGSDYWSSDGANKCHINTEKARADKPNNLVLVFKNLITTWKFTVVSFYLPVSFWELCWIKRIAYNFSFEVLYGDTLPQILFIKCNMHIERKKIFKKYSLYKLKIVYLIYFTIAYNYLF